MHWKYCYFCKKEIGQNSRFPSCLPEYDLDDLYLYDVHVCKHCETVYKILYRPTKIEIFDAKTGYWKILKQKDRIYYFVNRILIFLKNWRKANDKR